MEFEIKTVTEVHFTAHRVLSGSFTNCSFGLYNFVKETRNLIRYFVIKILESYMNCVQRQYCTGQRIRIDLIVSLRESRVSGNASGDAGNLLFRPYRIQFKVHVCASLHLPLIILVVPNRSLSLHLPAHCRKFAFEKSVASKLL